MAQIALLLDDSLLARIDETRGKQPRLSWIRDAIALKLGTPSILDAPMVPHETAPRVVPLRGGPEKPPPANSVVPMPAHVKDAVRTSRYHRDPEQCEHKYRDNTNRCFACGDQR